jgi:hypothetical protein
MLNRDAAILNKLLLDGREEILANDRGHFDGNPFFGRYALERKRLRTLRLPAMSAPQPQAQFASPALAVRCRAFVCGIP